MRYTSEIFRTKKDRILRNGSQRFFEKRDRKENRRKDGPFQTRTRKFILFRIRLLFDPVAFLLDLTRGFGQSLVLCGFVAGFLQSALPESLFEVLYYIHNS